MYKNLSQKVIEKKNQGSRKKKQNINGMYYYHVLLLGVHDVLWKFLKG